MIRQNVRNGEQVLGDVFSFVGRQCAGGRAAAGLPERLPHARPGRRWPSVVQDLSERAMRRAIAAIPDGVYRGESWFNPLGTPLT
jgi:5-oxoprolinase (ATP-hydrolysing)